MVTRWSGVGGVTLWRIVISKRKYQGSSYFLKSCYTTIVPGVLLYEESGYKYYKIPVAYGTRMNLEVVTDTCKSYGMKSVCLRSDVDIIVTDAE